VTSGCAFDLAHYVELLDAAKAGGYKFVAFKREPRPGDLLLRHDVDMSLAAAVTMAELEAEHDVSATYFLMTRSDFYNLDSPSGVAAAVRTTSCARAASTGCSCSCIPRSGSTTARRCGRRCHRSSTPSVSCGGSSSQRTGST